MARNGCHWRLKLNIQSTKEDRLSHQNGSETHRQKPDILARIEAYKRREVFVAKGEISSEAMLKLALRASPPRGFASAIEAHLREGRPALIAEIKKASPSKGLIRPDFDPPGLARAYLEGGASCISVLTDEPSFQGHLDYLRLARLAQGLFVRAISGPSGPRLGRRLHPGYYGERQRRRG